MSFDLSPELESRLARFAEETGLPLAQALDTLVWEGLRQMLLSRKKAMLANGDPERTIGAFADSPEFVEVIAGGEARYSKIS